MSSIGRRVVCAAVRRGDGLIVCGARHYDPLMREMIYALHKRGLFGWKRSHVAAHLKFVHVGANGPEQGFVDQFQHFMTREEAWKIAQASGQIIPDHPRQNEPEGVLYSEDLY